MSNTKNAYIKLLGVSFIPILVLLGGTIAGIFLFPNELSVNLNNEYIDDLSTDLHDNSIKAMQTLDSFFNELSGLVKMTENLIIEIDEAGMMSQRISYTYTQGTFYPEFSEKHNTTVDFSSTSYKTFGNLTEDLNNTISVSAELDAYLPSIYQASDQLMYIEIAYETGVHRMYPHGIQSEETTDPRITAWYNETKFTTEIVVSNPSIYNNSKDVIIQISKRINSDSGFIGVMSMAFLFEPEIDLILDGTTREDQRIFLFNQNMKIISHPDIDATYGDWEKEDLNHTLYEYEIPTGALNDSINIALAGNISSTVIIGDSIITIVPSNTTRFILGSIIDYPDTGVYGEYSLQELLVIPVLFFILFAAISFTILKKYGLIKTIDLEKLASMDIVGTVMDHIPTSMEDIDNMITDKIEDIGQNTREFVDDAGSELINKGIDKISDLEEKTLDKIDDAIDKGIDKLDQIEKNVIEKRDEFADNVFDKGEKMYKQLENMGVDFEAVKNGDFTSLAKVAADSKRLEVLISKTETIDINKLAKVLKKDPVIVKNWIDQIPEDFGISMDDQNIVHINHDQVMKVLPDIIKSYTGIDLASIDVEAVLKSDFSSIAGVTEEAKAFGKIMNEVDSANLDTVANTINMDPKVIRQWVDELPPDSGIMIELNTIKFDKEKLNKNLPNLIKSFMSI